MTEYKNIPIKEWAEDDRPREKMLTHGVSVLSDAELLAILISTGTKELTAVDIAKQLLNSVDNNLNLLGKKSLSELQTVRGIGEAKAVTIVASLELGKRRRMSDMEHRIQITKSETVFSLFHSILSDLPYEEFWVLFLNRANRVIGKEIISRGGTAGTVVDIKIIMKYALDKLASSIILIHNHPSGSLHPSKEDISITQKIKKASEILDINTLDHIIIADSRYTSMADEGLI